MLTRREAVIDQPFRDRRYRQHRRKVMSATPRIDATPPTPHPHLTTKLKKLRLEEDRQNKICEDNIRLAYKMAVIMRSKRLDNYNYGPVGPYDDVCPGATLLPILSPMKQKKKARPGDNHALKTVTTGTTVDKRASRKPTVLLSDSLGSDFNQKNSRRIQHRAPAGSCLVPRVGSAKRIRPLTVSIVTNDIDKQKSRKQTRPKSARHCKVGNLSVRRQLEPLVTLTGDSRQDSSDSESKDEDQSKSTLLQQEPEQFREELQDSNQSSVRNFVQDSNHTSENSDKTSQEDDFFDRYLDTTSESLKNISLDSVVKREVTLCLSGGEGSEGEGTDGVNGREETSENGENGGEETSETGENGGEETSETEENGGDQTSG